MSFVDFDIDFALDRLMKSGGLRPEDMGIFLLANVVQTVAVSGGLV